jgi:hypothetical protein
MTESQAKPKPERSPRKNAQRKYESEAVALQSLRLIAAPDAKDDLSREELNKIVKGSKGYSSEIVQHLIEYIKSI